MGEEIEKKFLLREDGQDYYTTCLSILYPSLLSLQMDVLKNGRNIRQGYLDLDTGILLAESLGMVLNFSPKEARLRDKSGEFYLTLKGDGSLIRGEKERRIPEIIFNELWNLTKGRRIEKIRMNKPYQNYIAEIDVYTDRQLMVAEVKVPSVEIANSLPPLGKDITEDSKYKNRNLAK